VAATFYLVLTTVWDLVQVRLERHYGKGYAQEKRVVRMPQAAAAL
jgi:polar amino acid transport system permease protein